jgi:hypothetical protein
MKSTTMVILALLNGLALGGLTAILLVRQLLLTIMYRLVTATAQAEILNVLDHLLPYVAAYVAAVVVMMGLTVLVVTVSLARKSGGTGQAQVSAA